MAHDHLNARSAGNVTLGGVGGPRDQRRDLLARLAPAAQDVARDDLVVMVDDGPILDLTRRQFEPASAYVS